MTGYHPKLCRICWIPEARQWFGTAYAGHLQAMGSTPAMVYNHLSKQYDTWAKAITQPDPGGSIADKVHPSHRTRHHGP